MNKKKKTGQIGKALVMITQLSISVLVPIILCTAVGIFIEKRFGINLILVLIILGILSGAQSGYRMMKQVLEDDAREDSRHV
jgi:hypothetical protein